MIIWGALLMIAFFAQYATLIGHLPQTMLGVWIPAFVIGMLLSIYVGSKEHRRDPAGDNLAITAYQAAFGMVGIGVMIYFFTTMITNTFDPQDITILSAALYGGAYYVIASVTKIKGLYFAAIGWWLILLYVSQLETFEKEMLLVMAIACGLLILLPGEVMRRACRDISIEE